MALDEGDDERLAAVAADAGREVPIEHLKPVPARTLKVNGRQFRHYSSLARTCKRRSICCMPVASPLSLGVACWSIFSNLVDMTYTAFIVALSVGFNHSAGEQHSWLSGCDWFGSAVYILDIVVNFNTGIVVTWGSRAVVVRDARTCAWYYIRHGTFVVDFVATIPFVVQVAVACTGYSGHLLRIVYTLRLLRLLRVARLLVDLSPGSIGGPMRPIVSLLSPRMVLLFTSFFSLAVLVNLLGCLWWNMALDEGLENSWAAFVQNKDYDLLAASDPNRWTVSCYFALTTLVTIGYGDVVAVTFREVRLVLLFEVVGVAFFGYLLNSVANVLAVSGPGAKRTEAIKEKLQEVEENMVDLGLPNWLKRKIRGYYAFRWHPEANHEARCAFYQDLPAKLATRLVQQRQEAALADLHFFPPDLRPKQSRAAAHILATASAPVLLFSGQQLQDAATIRRQGQAAEEEGGPCFFILEEGEMRVVHKGDETRVRRHAVGSRINFSGPAVIGIAALFSPAACQHQDDRRLAAVAPQQASDDDGDSSSSSSSGGSSHAGPIEDPIDDDASAWQQHALALTECHLWRINCRQLYAALRQSQPAVLLHLVRRLLGTLGVRAGGGGGGTSTGATLAPNSTGGKEAADSSAQHQQFHLQHSMVDRLRRIATELEAASEQQQRKDQQPVPHNGGTAGRVSLATSLTTSYSLSRSSWRTDPSVELASVAVGEPGVWGSAEAADNVWHTD